MRVFSKEELIAQLKAIKERGWIQSARQGNTGGIGNTIEDLLGITENNLPIPNAAEWELKTRRIETSSLTTLFHSEPSPRALKIVPAVLLPLYGWRHRDAGGKYPDHEMSFRQTINALARTDRGFGIVVDRDNERLAVSFDANCVNEHHHAWLREVEHKVGLGELNPQPYWGFDDIFHAAGRKLVNMFYLTVTTRRAGQIEEFRVQNVHLLQRFDRERFISAIEKGLVLIDFDARTGHNHGTKFRSRLGVLPEFYSEVRQVL